MGTAQRLDSTAPELSRTVADLAELLDGVERLGVAFSGGVDSAVLLALAVRALPVRAQGADRVLALLGVSPSLAARERTAAHDTAAVIGAPVVEVNTYEGDDPAYRANGVDRCFHCKNELFDRIDAQLVREHRLDAVAYGENADDARRIDRPGARAATEHRVLRPLADLGLAKNQVRDLAHAMDLPCADKPAAPCLASRIPHHSEVTPEKLRQIDRAEAALAALGLRDFRVRHHGELARVELSPEDLVEALRDRSRVTEAVRRAGFAEAVIDPAGLQSGVFTLTALREPRD